MKKKLFATILLSTVALSQGAVVAGVSADSTDDKIAAQDNKINSINQQQQSAQAQVDQIQGQVSEIKKQQENLQAENDRLNEESERLSAEIDELSKNIVARQESLANQARSAQTTGTATSYINAIVSSGSLTEAISRISAMNEIADANNKMLQEQKRDKEDIAQKQKENNDAINTVIANKQQLEDDAQALSTKEAELKVAQLNLAAEKSSAENEKNALLQQKAEAEKGFQPPKTPILHGSVPRRSGGPHPPRHRPLCRDDPPAGGRRGEGLYQDRLRRGRLPVCACDPVGPGEQIHRRR